MKLIKISIFLILILYIFNYKINYVSTAFIQFNSTLSCSLNEPCDFNSKSSWSNQQIPSANDDIIIDYSNSTNTQGVYITAFLLNTVYNSIKIMGNITHPQLIFTNCNLNVTKSFQLIKSTILINQTSDSKMLNNYDLNGDFNISTYSGLYVYDNNAITVNSSISLDLSSKLHFYDSSLLHCNGNATFFNRLHFYNSSMLITLADKNNNHTTAKFHKGLYSTGSVTLGKSNFTGGITLINNLMVNDQITLDMFSNFTVNGKLNSIVQPTSEFHTFKIKNNSILSIKSTLINQKLVNVELINNGTILINNPTIALSEIHGNGTILFDTINPNFTLKNILSSINSKTISIGLSGQSSLEFQTIQIGNVFDFKSEIYSNIENTYIGITGQCSIYTAFLNYTKLSIESSSDKLSISTVLNTTLITPKQQEHEFNFINKGIYNINGGQFSISNSTISTPSIESNGITTIKNSTINGNVNVYSSTGQLIYENKCYINGNLQLYNNGSSTINYNEIENKLSIIGKLLLDSESFNIIANQNYLLPEPLLNNTMEVNIIELNNSNIKINYYFNSNPDIGHQYQLFKTSYEIPSSSINVKLISSTGILNDINLVSKFNFNKTSNIQFIQFSNHPSKHLNGFEVFLIVISCIAAVALLFGLVYKYLKYKRFDGYLPINN